MNKTEVIQIHHVLLHLFHYHNAITQLPITDRTPIYHPQQLRGAFAPHHSPPYSFVLIVVPSLRIVSACDFFFILSVFLFAKHVDYTIEPPRANRGAIWGVWESGAIGRQLCTARAANTHARDEWSIIAIDRWCCVVVVVVVYRCRYRREAPSGNPFGAIVNVSAVSGWCLS